MIKRKKQMIKTPKELADAFPGNFWYLASPYSKWRKGPDDAAKTIASIAGRLIKQGLHVFCPIAHGHCIALAAGMSLTADYGVWLPLDKSFVDAAAGLIIADMPGWHESHGVGEETKWTVAAGKPVLLLSTKTLTMTDLGK